MNLLILRLRALLLACLLSFGLAACGEQVELLSAVSEQEANEILSTLLSAGLDARKVPGKEGMVSVVVEDGRVAEALKVMRVNGLPREQFARMGEVFRKEGLISSPLEERARYNFALSQELAETLSQIDGVITARVHLVLPDRSAGASEPLSPSSAAVFIKYKEVYDLESVVPQIKRLVTNSISHLSYDNVSVVLVPSMAALAGAAAMPAPPAEAPVALYAALAAGGLLLGGAGGVGGVFAVRRFRAVRSARQADDAVRA